MEAIANGATEGMKPFKCGRDAHCDCRNGGYVQLVDWWCPYGFVRDRFVWVLYGVLDYWEKPATLSDITGPFSPLRR